MRPLPAARVAGFTTAALLPAVATLASLPVLARTLTGAEWAGVAVGQSVGAMVGLVAGLGWALSGPSAVAAATDAGRRSLYESSLWMRAGAWVLAVAVGMVITSLLVADAARLLSVLVCAATGLVALSPRWYLVGTGSVRDLLRFDVAPVVAAHLVTAAGLVAGASPLLFPAAMAAAYVLASVGFAVALSRRTGRDPLVRASLASRWVPTATEVVGGAYSTVNVALVSVQVSVVALAGYASGWKFYQWALVVVAGVCQSLQAWVAVASQERGPRFRTALALHAAVGVAGLLGFVLLCGPLSSIMFGADLRVPGDVAAWFGAAVLFLSLNSSLGRHVLTTVGRMDVVLRSTVVGALVGVPAILVLSGRYGAAGGAAGLAATEALVFAYQLFAAWPLLRGRPVRG